MIRWFALNPVAANLLMVMLLLMGLLAIKDRIPLEVFPPLKVDAVQITTFQAGTTPSDIEQGITLRIEEAIADLEGIKEINSRSSESISSVTAQVSSGHDIRKLLEDIKLRVDALNTLPDSAERPIIQQTEFLLEVMNVVISGNVPRIEVLPHAERIRDDIKRLDGVSDVRFLDKPGLEISIEIEPDTLKQYGISLQQVGERIAANTVEISAGNLKTDNGQILIRTNGRAYTADEFRQLPIVTNPAGAIVYLDDIATIYDGFEPLDLDTRFNGEPSLSLSVYRSGTESAVRSARVVREYIESQQDKMPKGIHLNYWRDSSVIVQSRLKTLTNSAIQGGLLVLLLLTLFLRPAVAFWVCLGIPVCFLAAISLMPTLGVSFNMISLFGFILVLGIVVDDAIVTGESIFKHLRRGKDSTSAAIDGTYEVAVPVTFGILTTVVAFVPLLLVGGSAGDIFKNIPLIAIPVLLFSLVESKLILPAHMRHVQPRTESEKLNVLSRWQQNFSLGFERSILKFYQPALRVCLNNKILTIVCMVLITAIILTIVQTGRMRFVFFPEVDDEAVIATLTMPSNAGFIATNKQIQHMVNAAKALQDEYRNAETGESVIEYVVSFSGVTITGGLASNTGLVAFEVQAPEVRGDISIADLADQWRENIGAIPGAEKLTIQSKIADAGRPIQVNLRGGSIAELKAITSKTREHLQNYADVFDIQDNLSDGKEEFQVSLKKEARTLGLSQQDIAIQMRHAVFGYEAQQFQRNRDEVSVYLRYPKSHRSSIEDLQTLPIQLNRLEDQQTVELQSVANIQSGITPTALYRIDQQRTASISSDVDKQIADIEAIKRGLKEFLSSVLADKPDITFELAGEAKEQREALESLAVGGFLVLIAIYALLAIPFKSYWQPFIVMSVIPLGFVGAALGHMLMGANLSLLSFMGLLALTGVVVNDSLVLVDYINKQKKAGHELMEAVLNAGAARFRPVMLTSLTTFAGLTPILLEKSTQAQFLQPMAISLGFGILFATIITLIIVPVNYIVFHEVGNAIKWMSARLFLKPVSKKGY